MEGAAHPSAAGPCRCRLQSNSQLSAIALRGLAHRRTRDVSHPSARYVRGRAIPAAHRRSSSSTSPSRASPLLVRDADEPTIPFAPKRPSPSADKGTPTHTQSTGCRRTRRRPLRSRSRTHARARVVWSFACHSRPRLQCTERFKRTRHRRPVYHYRQSGRAARYRGIHEWATRSAWREHQPLDGPQAGT